MNAHFIDLDIIIQTESKPWIVSKDKPNFPILKMEKTSLLKKLIQNFMKILGIID